MIFESWLLVFIMLTKAGEIETHEVDSFTSLEKCFEAMEVIVYEAGDPEPFNWDFVCLEDIRDRT